MQATSPNDRSYSRFQRVRPTPDEAAASFLDDWPKPDLGPEEQDARGPGYRPDGVPMVLGWSTWRLPRVDLPLVLVAPQLSQDIADYLALGFAWIQEQGDLPAGGLEADLLDVRTCTYRRALFPCVQRLGVALLRLAYDLTEGQANARLYGWASLFHDEWAAHHAICEAVLAYLPSYQDALPPARIDGSVALQAAADLARQYLRECEERRTARAANGPEGVFW